MLTSTQLPGQLSLSTTLTLGSCLRILTLECTRQIPLKHSHSSCDKDSGLLTPPRRLPLRWSTNQYCRSSSTPQWLPCGVCAGDLHFLVGLCKPLPTDSNSPHLLWLPHGTRMTQRRVREGHHGTALLHYSAGEKTQMLVSVRF